MKGIRDFNDRRNEKNRNGKRECKKIKKQREK